MHNCAPASCQLVLFDRWDREVYRAESPDQAWTGTVDGAAPTAGIHIWRLSMSWDDDDAVQRTERRWHVIVLR